MGRFTLPSVPYELWQLDFIHLFPSQGYKYVLVMIYLYSHFVEAFPYYRVTALAVAKVLLEKIIPNGEFHLNYIVIKELYIIKGQIIKEVCEIWPILQHFHCTYYPLSSGLVERTNDIGKTQHKL